MTETSQVKPLASNPSETSWLDRNPVFFDDSGPRDIENIDATWQQKGKKKKDVKEASVQTHLHSKRLNRGAQTTSKQDAGMQTLEMGEHVVILKDNSPALAAFLRKCEPEISKQLTTNSMIRGFDSYVPNWLESDNSEALTRSFALTVDAGLGLEMEISSVSWNCNGSVIAVAFGSEHHVTWCSDHKGGVATWNVDRAGMRQGEADQWQETSSCLMTIEWHPGLPSILAGGNFLGEILIWNWSKDDEPLLGQTEAETSGHREPVTQVRWLPDEKVSLHRRQKLLTCGTDGRILLWQIALSHPSHLLEPLKTFELKAADIPRDIKKTMGHFCDPGKRESGVNCMVLCLNDASHFIIGGETGGIFRGAMGPVDTDSNSRNRETLTSSKHGASKQGKEALKEWQESLKAHPDSPVVLAFKQHDGPVYSIDFSPFHRNLFLTCGADSSVRLYHQFQTSPTLTVTPLGCENSPLLAVRWSPKRPLVFATCAANGVVALYDLGKSTTKPYSKIQLNPDLMSAATSISFNPKLPLIAVGAGDGSTEIWRLPVTLTERIPRALQILSSIAGEVEDIGS